MVFYNGSEEEGRAEFKPFFDLSKLLFDYLIRRCMFLKLLYRTHCRSYKRDTIRRSQCNAGYKAFRTSDLIATDPPAQNGPLGHGQCRLIKALSHAKPHLPSAKKVLDRLVSLADSEIYSAVVLEYFPLKKMLSIPNGTCAFQRPKFRHGFTMISWKENTPENSALARSIARDLVDIVATGQLEYIGQVEQGYGNYGTLV